MVFHVNEYFPFFFLGAIPIRLFYFRTEYYFFSLVMRIKNRNVKIVDMIHVAANSMLYRNSD